MCRTHDLGVSWELVINDMWGIFNRCDMSPDGDLLIGSDMGFEAIMNGGEFLMPRIPIGSVITMAAWNAIGGPGYVVDFKMNVNRNILALTDEDGNRMLYIERVIEENMKPVASNNTLVISQGQSQNITVLKNDTDPDDEMLFIIYVEDIQEHIGTLSISGDTSIWVLPNPDFFGSFSYDYVISDSGGRLDTATVVITIEEITVVGGGALNPDDYALYPNHPNPFNSFTRIRYTLAEPADVCLSVCDLQGREIIRLVSEKESAGQHEITWGGRDARGTGMPSGVCLIRMEAGKFTEVMKMVLVR